MRARLVLSRTLAVTGLAAVVAGAVTAPAGTSSATAPPSQKSAAELLSGGDGSVAPRIENGRDKLLSVGALGARSAVGVDRAVSARLAAVKQAASLPVAGNSSWRAAHDVFRADDERFSVASLGWLELGGRTTALAVDPRDTSGDTIWAGAAGGGVWRSTDGGESWTPTFDDQPSTAIGALALSPRTGWVYAGTGEANTNGDGLYGTGVYRTKDNGKTWQRVAANIGEATVVSHIAVSRPEGATADHVFVASSEGLYVSTNGGDSYVNAALPTNEDGTAPYTKTRFGNFVTDVRVKPDDPSVVTAAVGWRRGKQVDYQGNPDSVGNGLYRSTEAGRPGTWERLDNNLGEATAQGASDDPLGRISLAYAEGPDQDNNIMWAVVQDAGLFTQDPLVGLSTTTLPAAQRPTTLAGVYQSLDNGVTWFLKATAPSFLGSPGTSMATLLAGQSLPGVQAWYDQYVEVDPTDINRVIVGLEEVYSSVGNPNVPGAPAQFKTISRYWNTCAVVLDCSAVPTYDSTTAHPDQHVAQFAKVGDTGVRLYIGNDGGVFSQEADPIGTSGNELGGYDNASWQFQNVGYTTTQPNYAVIGGDGTIYAGQQDNGTLKVEPGSRTAVMILGGDGVDVAVDPTDSDIVHAETQNGAFRSSSDGGQTFGTRTTNITNPLFYTPFEMDPTDPEHLVIGGRQVAEKTDGAGGSPFTVSFDLGMNARTGIVNQVSALDLRGNAVYAGFCGACDPLNQGNNDPASFQNGIASNVAPGCEAAPGSSECWSIRAAKGLPNRYITDVKVDPVDPKTVYVSLGNYGRRWFKVADDAPGNADGNVWVSKDAGATFTNLSGDLPDAPATALEIRDDKLIVGTEVGVFIAPKTGGSWSRLGSGLPNTAAFDINLDPKGRKLVAALHGRSVWTYDFGAAAVTPPVTAPGGETGGPGNGGVIPVTGGVPLAAVGVGLLAAAVLVRRRALRTV
jgi:hypothetical protein